MDDYELEEYLMETFGKNFTLNPPQALAFTTLVCRLQTLAKKTGGAVEPVHLVPPLGCGDVTAVLPILNLSGKALQKLCHALRYASAVTVDALIDGNICISLTVPDVFIKKLSAD